MYSNTSLFYPTPNSHQQYLKSCTYTSHPIPYLLPIIYQTATMWFPDTYPILHHCMPIHYLPHILPTSSNTPPSFPCSHLLPSYFLYIPSPSINTHLHFPTTSSLPLSRVWKKGRDLSQDLHKVTCLTCTLHLNIHLGFVSGKVSGL